MEARSTNVLGFVHYGGDVVAGVNDGIAIHLKSASTGGTAVIEPLSDSDTAALTVRAKGAATLTLGNSSNGLSLAGSGLAAGSTGIGFSSTAAITATHLTLNSSRLGLNSTSVGIGTGSSTFFTLVQKYTVEFTEPDCAATTSVISTYTVTGLTTNSNLIFTPRLPTAPSYVWSARCSTANELCITWTNVAVSSNSGSSNRGTLLAFNYV